MKAHFLDDEVARFEAGLKSSGDGRRALSCKAKLGRRALD